MEEEWRADTEITGQSMPMLLPPPALLRKRTEGKANKSPPQPEKPATQAGFSLAASLTRVFVQCV